MRSDHVTVTTALTLSAQLNPAAAHGAMNPHARVEQRPNREMGAASRANAMVLYCDKLGGATHHSL
jgi:putative hemolysin